MKNREKSGFFDMNIKEICLGDLVKIYDGRFCEVDDILAIKKVENDFVIYNPNCCENCRKGDGSIENLDFFKTENCITVIGDIYKNFDLLEGN
jgi:uncharacterized phage protein (TIGR01671 family)